MPKLSHAGIRGLRIILLSLGEQKLILDRLNKVFQNIQQASKAILKHIKRILEYRTRLISDAVTGQMDVRDIVIPDFEQVEGEQVEKMDNEGDEIIEGMAKEEDKIRAEMDKTGGEIDEE